MQGRERPALKKTNNVDAFKTIPRAKADSCIVVGGTTILRANPGAARGAAEKNNNHGWCGVKVVAEVA